VAGSPAALIEVARGLCAVSFFCSLFLAFIFCSVLFCSLFIVDVDVDVVCYCLLLSKELKQRT
jgi:hypothetical protein